MLFHLLSTLRYSLHIASTFLTIATNEEQNLNAVENSCKEAVQLALQEWARLPSIVSHSHVPILEAAQRFVELRESAQLCHAMNTQMQPPQDLNSLVELWRKRLPNSWDEMEVWQDLLEWRCVHLTWQSAIVLGSGRFSCKRC